MVGIEVFNEVTYLLSLILTGFCPGGLKNKKNEFKLLVIINFLVKRISRNLRLIGIKNMEI